MCIYIYIVRIVPIYQTPIAHVYGTSHETSILNKNQCWEL